MNKYPAFPVPLWGLPYFFEKVQKRDRSGPVSYTHLIHGIVFNFVAKDMKFSYICYPLPGLNPLAKEEYPCKGNN